MVSYVAFLNLYVQGITAKFESMILVRQAHGFAFGKSDLFMLAALRLDPPDQDQLVPQESEIEAACWLPIRTYGDQEVFKGVPLYEKLVER